MTRITTSLAAALVATAMLSAPLYAQTTPSTTPSTTTPATTPTEPSTADKVKNMTMKQWAKLVAEWRKDKAKYTGCRDAAKGLKLKARWTSIYDCMTAK